MNAPPVVWEIRVEADSGLVMDDDWRQWEGWRVKYRRLGSRGRWSKFVTESDLTNCGVGALQRLCSLHSEHVTTGGRGAAASETDWPKSEPGGTP